MANQSPESDSVPVKFNLTQNDLEITEVDDIIAPLGQQKGALPCAGSGSQFWSNQLTNAF